MSSSPAATALTSGNSPADKFKSPAQETSARPDEPLPERLVTKDWQHLVQPRLNVAWLPPDEVFLRVVQLPKADPAETLSMVELQLEKISPLPVAQIVWCFESSLRPAARCKR